MFNPYCDWLKGYWANIFNTIQSIRRTNQVKVRAGQQLCLAVLDGVHRDTRSRGTGSLYWATLGLYIEGY